MITKIIALFIMLKKKEFYKIQNLLTINNYKNLFFETINEYKQIIDKINKLNNDKEIYLLALLIIIKCYYHLV